MSEEQSEEEVQSTPALSETELTDSQIEAVAAKVDEAEGLDDEVKRRQLLLDCRNALNKWSARYADSTHARAAQQNSIKLVQRIDAMLQSAPPQQEEKSNPSE